MIKKQDRVVLTENQLKMIKSGWGAEVVENTSLSKIHYVSDDLEVLTYLSLPKSFSGKLPVIIWLRGGYGNDGLIDEFNAYGIFGKLASAGYAVFAPQYRGNKTSGGVDEFGGDDLNDVLNLIELLNEFPFADTSRIALEGWSRGGMMAYNLLRKSDKIKTALILGGISNIAEDYLEPKLLDSLKRKLFNGKDFIKEFEKRSVLKNIDSLNRNCKLFLIHGTDDERVYPNNSIDLTGKLLDLGIHNRLLLVENGDHFLRKYRNEIEIYKNEWYKKYL